MENRTTVFYVDDNPKSSRLLTSVLEHSGFKVISKNAPIEALALGGGPWGATFGKSGGWKAR